MIKKLLTFCYWSGFSVFLIYAFLKFLEKRGIRNTISIISVYIYSLEMIIVNSGNTSVTNRRCIRIVRTGETAYVNVIIFDLYVGNIWKAIDIRLKGSLGSVKINTDRGILPGDPDRYGIRRVNLSGIPDSDHSRNRDTA